MVVQHLAEVGLRWQASVVAREHASEPEVLCTQAAGQVVLDRPAERVVDNAEVVLNKQAVLAQEEEEEEVVVALALALVDVELLVVPVASALKLLEQVPAVKPIAESTVELIVEQSVADVVAAADIVAAQLVIARTASVVRVETQLYVLVQVATVLPELSVAVRTERQGLVEIETEFAG